MSVYINMEMPSCCGECRFLDEYGDYPNCIITDEQRGYNFRVREKRMPHCPLVPVQPHGRLIDAGKAYEDAITQVSLAFASNNKEQAAMAVANVIWNAPTIIPADKEGEG